MVSGFGCLFGLLEDVADLLGGTTAAYLGPFRSRRLLSSTMRGKQLARRARGTTLHLASKFGRKRLVTLQSHIEELPMYLDPNPDNPAMRTDQHEDNNVCTLVGDEKHITH